MNFIQTSFNFLASFSRPPITKNFDLPDLVEIWNRIATSYFPNEAVLSEYKIVWSTRHQTYCLGSCNISKKIVRIAPAMQLAESHQHLEALIYHEMCHAIVGIRIKNGRRQMHTKEFKQLERIHPGTIPLDTWIKAGGWSMAVKKSRRKNLLLSKRNLLNRTKL